MSDDYFVYERGQVYHWEDPIYGRKDAGKAIDTGEGTMRYSRYVMIIENIPTGTHVQFVGIIPISTSNGMPLDVKLKLNGEETHLKCSRIMSTHVSTLRRYICTVYPHILEKVDESLSALYITKPKDIKPDKMRPVISPEVINILCGDAKPTKTEVTSGGTCATKGTEIEDKPDLSAIQKAVSEIVEPVLTDESDIVDIEEDEYDEVEETIDQSNPTVLVPTSMSTKNNPAVTSLTTSNGKKLRYWKEIDKRDFVEFYCEFGVDETSKLYHMATGTTNNYFNKWKKEFPDVVGPNRTLDREQWPIEKQLDFINKCDLGDMIHVAAREYNLKLSTAKNYYYKWRAAFSYDINKAQYVIPAS